jgi:hypothetical protein
MCILIVENGFDPKLQYGGMYMAKVSTTKDGGAVDWDFEVERMKTLNVINDAQRETERAAITVGRMFDSPFSRVIGTVTDNVKWFFEDLLR